MVLIAAICMCSCKNDTETQPPYMPKIENISLSHKGQRVSEVLPIDGGNINLRLKYNSYWIQELECQGNTLKFYAVENLERDRGYRSDTIYILRNNSEIGKVCVVQARNCISEKPLKWARAEAKYSKEQIAGLGLSGQEITRLIYNLEKTTQGTDTYKNYPAFAYCIEMNIDPENNLEWHLPDIGQIEDCQEMRQDYKDTPFGVHNNWWSASDRDGAAYWITTVTGGSYGPSPKSNEYYVMAFKDGEIIE